jgi:IclR family transcriptional regulator, acetate operon repressor
MPAVAYSPTRKASVVTHWQSDRRPGRAQGPDALAALARPWLCWMRARTGLTASLAVLERDELVYLAWLPSRRVGQAEPAAARQARWSAAPHTRAAGLALLAYTADSDWPAGTRMHADVHGLRERLLDAQEEICVQGWACSESSGGQAEVGVAAAVLGATEPIAAVELSVFGEQAREFSLRVLAGVVVAAADGIAEQLEDDSRTVA